WTLSILKACGGQGMDDRAVNLGQAEQADIGRQRLRNPAAVLGHRFGSVFRARPAIQRGINAFRHAAVAAEEAMSNAGARQILCLEPLHDGKPATFVSAGGISASALNRWPILSLPISRS